MRLRARSTIPHIEIPKAPYLGTSDPYYRVIESGNRTHQTLAHLEKKQLIYPLICDKGCKDSYSQFCWGQRPYDEGLLSNFEPWGLG